MKKGLGSPIGCRGQVYYIIIGIILMTLVVFLSGCISQEKPAKGEMVFFTCPEDCPETIENLLANADERIICELYYFSNENYLQKLKGNALLNEDLEIRLLLDDNSANRETAEELEEIRNIDLKLIDSYTIFHSKICLIDNVLFIGSHNWSRNSAKQNREISILIFNSEGVIERYLEIFETDWKQAEYWRG
jgi:phosphatidylserine/phosphatidylglycerophosphate/cardiolipin synthase-like enzyme